MKIKCLLINSLLFSACSAHAQLNVNVLGALHSAQTMLQQPASPSTGVTPTAARPSDQKQNRSTSSAPTFDTVFGCDQPASSPLLSAFAIHNVKLGDVCAQPELTTGSPAGMVRGVENDMRQLAPTQDAAITRLSGGGSTLTLATVRAAARPAGLAKSVVIAIEEHVNATDATNSLQPGNSFRAALEQRYGTPSRITGAREKLSADHKTAEEGIRSRAKAFGIDSGQAIAKSVEVEDQSSRQWIACHPVDTVYELQWANPDGTLLVAKLTDGECGASPSFDLSLIPNPALPKGSQFLWSQWIQPVSESTKARVQARSANAPTPKF